MHAALEYEHILYTGWAPQGTHKIVCMQKYAWQIVWSSVYYTWRNGILECTDPIKKTVQGITYMCIKRIFDSPHFTLNYSIGFGEAVSFLLNSKLVEIFRKFKFLVKDWSIWKFLETFGVLNRPFNMNGIIKKKLMTKIISKFDSFRWLFR